MGKQSRNTRRFKTRSDLERETPKPKPRIRLWVVAGVVAILVIVAGAVAIAFAARPGSVVVSNGVPDGVQKFNEPNHDHVSGTVTYDHVPPAGGAHNPTPLNCGIYDQAVPNENAVHSLEHGAVWVTYAPSITADQIGALQQLVASHYVGTEKYIILSPYPGLPASIVASAWGVQLRVDRASDSRLLDFIKAYAGSGQGGEPGGACTGGVGSPVG